MARLPDDVINKMIIAHNEGMPRAEIARTFKVDPSTVSYHLERIERLYGTTTVVYSLVKPEPKPCEHPSLRCLVCGMTSDHIHRRDLETIHHLQAALEQANRIIITHGHEPVGASLIQ